jgi:hypothetical protein
VPRLINGEDSIRRLFEEAAVSLAHILTIAREDSTAPFPRMYAGQSDGQLRLATSSRAARGSTRTE